MNEEPTNSPAEVREFIGRDHVEALKKHFVGLYAANDVKAFFFSGFLLNAGDVWFWCSAGHCFKRLEELMASKISDFNLNPLSEKVGTRIPFRPQADLIRYLDDGKVDFGFMELDELYVRNLKAGGAVPLSIEDVRWTRRKGGGFIVLGIPGESVDLGPMRELGQEFEFTPIAMHLERIDDEDDNGLPSMNFRFDRRIHVIKGQTLNSVAGMSGGPIFGWYLDASGHEKYVPLAIQYGWDSIGTIRATPLVFVSGIIKHALEASRANPAEVPDEG